MAPSLNCFFRQYTELDAQVEGNLCAEVALIVLDKLELVIQVILFGCYFLV